MYEARWTTEQTIQNSRDTWQQGCGNQITEQQHGASASPVIESLLLPLLMPPPLLLPPLLLLLPPLLLLLPPLLLLLLVLLLLRGRILRLFLFTTT